jgi:transposase
VSTQSRTRSLEEAGLVHPDVGAITAVLFNHGSGFFLPADKVQVKYEMLRAHVVDGVPVSTAAADHGYSRASFYLVAASFEATGMLGLLDERRGRRGPLRLTPEIIAFLRTAEGSGAALAQEVEERFGVRLHRRTVERARS